MIIGVTGNSGSGKSTVAKLLSDKLKAEIIDADKIAREMFENCGEYYKAIEKEFGTKITRQELAKVIYKNSEKRKKLNDITNKYVVKEILEIVENKKSKDLILDVPLLYESNLNIICDKVVRSNSR